MSDDLFLSDKSRRSHRWAIVEDNGRSAWLYLTEPDSERPVAHGFLYNRLAAPAEHGDPRGEAPVVPVAYVANPNPFQPPAPEEFLFRWSTDGNAVAVFLAGELFAFVTTGSHSGYSKNLLAAGPYGLPLDAELYATLFREA